MQRVEARYRNDYEEIPKRQIFQAKQSLWRPMNYSHLSSDLTTDSFDKVNPIKSLDYVQLLTIDYNLLMAQEAKREQVSYLRVLRGLRRII